MLQITPIERVVLQSLAEGQSTSQIGTLLELHEGDVDDLLLALFTRMRVHTPLEAVAAAIKRGVIDGVSSAGDQASLGSPQAPAQRVMEVLPI